MLGLLCVFGAIYLSLTNVIASFRVLPSISGFLWVLLVNCYFMFMLMRLCGSTKTSVMEKRLTDLERGLIGN